MSNKGRMLYLLLLVAHSFIITHCVGVIGNAPPSEFTQASLLQFKLVTEDLAALIQHASGFIDWWTKVNTTLENLKTVLPQIKVDGTNPFRTETVKWRWDQVYQIYDPYQRQVRR